MSIIQIALIGIVGMFTALLLKNTKSEYAGAIVCVTGLLIFYYSIQKISVIFQTITLMKNKMKLSNEYYMILIKIVGISYICEFSSDICKDAGYGLIANQIQTFGKIMILAISANVFVNLLDVIWELL